MVKQLDALRPIWDYEIEVFDPIISDNGQTAEVGITVNLIANDRTHLFADILKHTIESLLLTEEQIAPMKQMGFKFKNISKLWKILSIQRLMATIPMLIVFPI